MTLKGLLTITQGIGGIYNRGGAVTLTNCTVSGNTTTGFGGGIRNGNGSPQDPIGTMSSNSRSLYLGLLFNGGMSDH